MFTDDDARLIAAAPEMLAALRDMLHEFDGNDDNTISLTMADRARALLAKIEGKGGQS